MDMVCHWSRIQIIFLQNSICLNLIKTKNLHIILGVKSAHIPFESKMLFTFSN